MTLVQADRVAINSKGDIGRITKEIKRNDLESLVLFVLTDSAWPYKVSFKNWERYTWKEKKEQRQGRLLEPYITLLQQKFALYFHRQGLPRLPEDYFLSLDEAKLGCGKLLGEGI